ncbi:TVP38/TMEM64 family protein [Litorimonas sp. RW-G-Af-16]|uniref:TVP38/TMEM64 family protein n=1 Tax=Litorimonas sp. RW-G-Af-16 TaxID=3241168 RepID=UPI00390CBAE5
MKQLWAFITQMDKKARRALGVTLLMFALVIGMIVLGKDVLSVNESEVNRLFEALRDSGWGLPATILVFCLAAFIGVPQWVLIAGVVLAFGPLMGSAYAWVATMLSASLDFWLGRWVGAERLRQYGGDLINRIIAIVQKNGFVTSFAVRFVPTGPFVLVNMAAGVSRMTFPAFAAGTGLGIIPKIAIVGLVAQGIVSGEQGKSVFQVFIGLAIVIIIGMFLARRTLQKRLNLDAENAPNK